MTAGTAPVDGSVSLHATLAALGWRSEPSDRGRRVFDAGGCNLGVHSAGWVWAELQARGLVRLRDAAGALRDPRDLHFHPGAPLACPCTTRRAA